MKDLNYWKNNAEEDYMTTPISVLKYITELEKAVATEVVRFKVGDKVKITNCFHGHGFKIDNVVTIISMGCVDILAEDDAGNEWYITEKEGVKL